MVVGAMRVSPARARAQILEAKLHPLRAVPRIDLQDAGQIHVIGRREPIRVQGAHAEADRIQQSAPIARHRQLEMVRADDSR